MTGAGYMAVALGHLSAGEGEGLRGGFFVGEGRGGIGSAPASRAASLYVIRLRKRRRVMWRLWKAGGYIVFECGWSITLGVIPSCSNRHQIEELRR